MVVGETSINNIMSGIENTGTVKLNNHRKKLKQRFDIIKKLGQGTYGKVQLGINKETGQEVAIKTIKKCKIETEADLIRIRREIQIMSSVQHPNIIHIYEVFENREKMILVMEYAAGGELYDYLSEKKVLTEDEARRIFRQIAIAVYYCHKHKICHRDLKLENILLDQNGNAKIADFGLSNVFDGNRLLSTFCGSPLYASPEIVKGVPYRGPEVDCWSLGVLLYTLVYGAMPFDGSHFKRLVKQISSGDFFEPKTPNRASPLIREMLEVDATKRADMMKVCSHWWVNEGYDTPCLDIAEYFAQLTPVRLDLLLTLAPALPQADQLIIANNNQSNEMDGGNDLKNSPSTCTQRSMSVGSILEQTQLNKDAMKESEAAMKVEQEDSLKRKLEITPSIENAQNELKRETPAEGCGGAKKKDRSRKKEKSVERDEKRASCKNKENDIQLSNKINDEKATSIDDKKVVADETTTKSSISPSKTIVLKKVNDDEVKQLDEVTNETKDVVIKKPTTTSTEVKKKVYGINVGSFKEAFERRASLTQQTTLPKPIIRPAMKKSISLDQGKKAADIESSKMVDRDKVQKAVSIISNAIEGSSARKSKSRPNFERPPPVPFGQTGRSQTSNIAHLISPINEMHLDLKKDDCSSESQSQTLPRQRKVTKAEITLKKPDNNTFTSEVKHTINQNVFRSCSLEPEKKSISTERIIPILYEATPAKTQTTPSQGHVTKSRLLNSSKQSFSRQSTQDSDTDSNQSQPGEPIRKSAREYIIPIAVEGAGYVTPRSTSLEPDNNTPTQSQTSFSTPRFGRLHRRMGSMFRDGSERNSSLGRGESDNETDPHHSFHRLRSCRRRDGEESISSGEEDEDDDDAFHQLTAENLFSTLLSRVRNLTQQLNVDDELDKNWSTNQSRRRFASTNPKFNQKADQIWSNFYDPFKSMFDDMEMNGGRGSSNEALKRRSRDFLNEKLRQSQSNTLPKDCKINEQLNDLTNLNELSCLTPGLSRRIQKYLLSQIRSHQLTNPPPPTNKLLRRTLSNPQQCTSSNPLPQTKSSSVNQETLFNKQFNQTLLTNDLIESNDTIKSVNSLKCLNADDQTKIDLFKRQSIDKDICNQFDKTSELIAKELNKKPKRKSLICSSDQFKIKSLKSADESIQKKSKRKSIIDEQQSIAEHKKSTSDQMNLQTNESSVEQSNKKSLVDDEQFTLSRKSLNCNSDQFKTKSLKSADESIQKKSKRKSIIDEQQSIATNKKSTSDQMSLQTNELSVEPSNRKSLVNDEQITLEMSNNDTVDKKSNRKSSLIQTNYSDLITNKLNDEMSFKYDQLTNNNHSTNDEIKDNDEFERKSSLLNDCDQKISDQLNNSLDMLSKIDVKSQLDDDICKFESRIPNYRRRKNSDDNEGGRVKFDDQVKILNSDLSESDKKLLEKYRRSKSILNVDVVDRRGATDHHNNGLHLRSNSLLDSYGATNKYLPKRHSSVNDSSILSKYLNNRLGDDYYYHPRGSSFNDKFHDRSISFSERSPNERPTIFYDRSISLNENLRGSSLIEQSTPRLATTSKLSKSSGCEPMKKRISRFLRPDFYETPAEDSIYLKEKKDKELETQRVLKEIRDKRLERRLRNKEHFEKQLAQLQSISSNDCNKEHIFENGGNVEENEPQLSPPSICNENLVEQSNLNEMSNSDVDKRVEENNVKVKKEKKISKLIRPKSYPNKSSPEKKVVVDDEKLEKKSIFEKFQDAKYPTRIGNAIRRLREQSLPRFNDLPPNESKLIKRALSIDDLRTTTNELTKLDNATTTTENKSVNKILNLFKRYESSDDSSSKSQKKKSKIPNKKVVTATTKSGEKVEKKTKLPKIFKGETKKTKIDETEKQMNDDVIKLELKNNESSSNEQSEDVSKISVNCESLLQIESNNSETNNSETNNIKTDQLNNSELKSNSEVDSSDIELKHSETKNREVSSNVACGSKIDNVSKICLAKPCRDFGYENFDEDGEGVIDRIRRKSYYTRFNDKKRTSRQKMVQQQQQPNNNINYNYLLTQFSTQKNN